VWSDIVGEDPPLEVLKLMALASSRRNADTAFCTILRAVGGGDLNGPENGELHEQFTRLP
jgi:hypothetical protein